MLLTMAFFMNAMGQKAPRAHSSAVAPHTISIDDDQLATYTSQHQRLDLRSGTIRAAYRITSSTGAATSSSESARNYLQRHHVAYGLSASLDELVEENVETTPYSTHISYRQVLAGIPVHGARLKVNLDNKNQPTLVLNSTIPQTTFYAETPSPQVTASAAADRIDGYAGIEEWRTTEPTLVFTASLDPVLAWLITGWPQGQNGEWEFLVDAKNGAIISAQEMSTHPLMTPIQFTPSLPGALPINDNLNAFGQLTGRGYVFDPDPLSTAGVTYGSPYLDNQDASNPQLQEEYIEVDLLDISQSNDGLYTLTGPHVQISGDNPNGGTNYTPPGFLDPAGFLLDRSSLDFEATMVYYHMDKSQRYIQSLNLGRDILNLSFSTNPHGLGSQDNSKFFPDLNFIAFGDGGVDDGEDATVIWHEYGHAILEASAPGLLRGSEGQALHEGWADYWAASYIRDLVDRGTIPRQDWESLFKWDSGDSAIWDGRTIAFEGTYPEDTRCDDGTLSCNIYADGALWATVLMEIFDEIGREKTDRLSLHSHLYLSHPVTFRDAAEAILQADVDLYGGANTQVISSSFLARGLLDISSRAPIVVHESVRSTEQVGGSISSTLEAIGVSAPVNSVQVLFDYGTNPQDTVLADLVSDNQFNFSIPLLDSPGIVRYAIIAEDTLGLATRFPSSETTFTFSFGPDNTPPTASHTPISTFELSNWPPLLLVAADDELGVDTVIVDFMIDDTEGREIAAGSFGLTLEGPRYRGVLPVSSDQVLPGSTVSYSILIQDKAIAANQTRLPESGTYAFTVRSENGILRYYDFESEVIDIQLSNLWEMRKPSLGTEVAPSDSTVLITRASTAYPETPGLSTITLPPINLTAFETPHLVFWHWYDTEYSEPSSSNSTSSLWDGGNVKVSIDGGTLWSLLIPERGYTNRIIDGTENPLALEQAFGGFSYGWQQEIIALPSEEVLIRFDFGTDNGNDEPALYYSGWMIDNITVMDRRPVDTSLPEPAVVPSEVTTRDPGQDLPVLLFGATDDTGISRVDVDYRVYASQSEEGRFRLPALPGSLSLFSGSFPLLSSSPLDTGDSLTYRFIFSDMEGNTGMYPGESSPPLRIEYRLREQINLLEQVSATGLWKESGAGWIMNNPGNASSGEVPPVSSLVFRPVDVPNNVDQVELVLRYQATLGNELGGNVKLSKDSAHTWNVLSPTLPYPGIFPGNNHAMSGEPVLTGTTTGQVQEIVFDVSDLSGQQIWFRTDFGALRALNEVELLKIESLELKYSTLTAVGDGFDIPLELTLHANYPDPFVQQTNISFTIPENGPVKLEVYDLLGRRIKQLVDSNLQAGTHTIQFDASGLPSGLYLARLSTNAGDLIERMILRR